MKMPDFCAQQLTSAPGSCCTDVSPVERVWQHRHDIDLSDFQPRNRARQLAIVAGTALFAVAVSVIAYNGPGEVHPRLEAARPLVDQSAQRATVIQSTVDASPALQIHSKELVADPTIPVPRWRPERDVPPVKKVKTAERIQSVTAENPPFNHCDHECETAGLLMANTAKNGMPPQQVMEDRGETRITSPLDLGRVVLSETAALPLATLKVGRDILIDLAHPN
ncbi:MAG TPA: hypothetical protein PKE16_12970 [Hyphomicrobium sp.]|nr:hypothetical protein [Hyphomicrobium sp.]